jgi:hypothetical protein
MLATNKYPRQYIEDCRTKVNARLKTYNQLIAAAKSQELKNEKELSKAIESFSTHFFNNLVGC